MWNIDEYTYGRVLVCMYVNDHCHGKLYCAIERNSYQDFLPVVVRTYKLATLTRNSHGHSRDLLSSSVANVPIPFKFDFSSSVQTIMKEDHIGGRTYI